MKKIIDRAIKSAKCSDVVRGKIGAVLFNQNNHIICYAHNSTFWGSNRFRTIHAEEALLNKAHKIKAFERYGNKLSMLIIRWKPNNTISLAKPCSACSKILLEREKLNTYYSSGNGDIVEY